MIYDTYNHSIHGLYKPTNITGGPNIVYTWISRDMFQRSLWWIFQTGVRARIWQKCMTKHGKTSSVAGSWDIMGCFLAMEGFSNLTKDCDWLVVWNMFYFSIYWECHHPNWQTPSFFRGVGWNHQPVEWPFIVSFPIKNGDFPMVIFPLKMVEGWKIPPLKRPRVPIVFRGKPWHHGRWRKVPDAAVRRHPRWCAEWPLSIRRALEDLPTGIPTRLGSQAKMLRKRVAQKTCARYWWTKITFYWIMIF